MGQDGQCLGKTASGARWSVGVAVAPNYPTTVLPLMAEFVISLSTLATVKANKKCGTTKLRIKCKNKSYSSSAKQHTSRILKLES